MTRFVLSLFALLLTLTHLQTGAAAERVLMNTNHGEIVLELYPEQAPRTVENFLRYVNEGYFSGTIFHRVIPDFMIQGGGFTADYERKETHDPIINEANNGLSNDRGTIAMARTNNPHSATAQFFINHKNNGFLNFRSKTLRGWGYTVFGRVVSGMDTVDSIADVRTGRGGPFWQDAPLEKVIIEQVRVID